jgi:uncharacterized protein (TIGR02145 family)
MKSTRSSILAATLGIALAFTLSCSDDKDDGEEESNISGCPDVKTSDNTVTCDGQTYNTVKIGDQTWMAENLNYNVSGSKCYGDDIENCIKYGRLYGWVTAMTLPSSCDSKSCVSKISAKHRGICPSGWHIPSDADWDKLYRYADGTSGTNSPYDSPTAGKFLKATKDWRSNNGMDDYNFTALPGGSGGSDGKFYYVGDHGYWWSSSEDYAYYAHYRKLDHNSNGAYWDGSSKSGLYSIRCLQD